MQRKYEIIIAVAITLSLIFVFFIIPDIDKVGSYITVWKDVIEFSASQVKEDNFIAFALTVSFIYELIPQTVQYIGVGVIGTRLLQKGFNPFVFSFVIAVGRLSGQMLLYMIGWLIKKFHGREFKMMEVIGSWFHKWHYIVFVFPPWLGIVGDGIMLGAGHESISPLRMIPILFASNYAEALKYVLPTMAQLGISDAVEQG